MKELLLIGTVHQDPDGFDKLSRLLAEECPVAVAVEVSPYGLYYRRKNGKQLRRQLMKRLTRLANEHKVSWRRWGQIDAIRIQLRVPFEYRSTQKYCRDTGAMLFCIDSSPWSKRWIKNQWKHLVSRENLELLLKQVPGDLRDEVVRGYRLAALLLRPEEQSLVSVFSGTWSADPSWKYRETGLAQALRRLYLQLQEGRLAYVGGWQHLLGPNAGGTIFERLKQLRPRRVLLDNLDRPVPASD